MPKKDEPITADTSALISLSVGSIITECLDIFDLVISPTVRDELRDMSGYSDKHAEGASQVLKMVSDREIEVKGLNQDKKVYNLVKRHPKLDLGETETLLLAEKNSIDVLITDDFRSLRPLKELSENVKIHLSVYPLARLVIKDKIGKERAEKTLEKIAEKRSWEGAAIYRYAKRYLDEL